ncbi:MAG: FKBP-type peptidyl-prolyl cis-trans isomerase [Bacteroidales bacterium]|jgi:FKBP-type peptidyl-prolyl cis-trans isomerase|nr:FKBP-type peptidyl-prolyl cis-trans isomerase [Bacteroidales bacterium]
MNSKSLYIAFFAASLLLCGACSNNKHRHISALSEEQLREKSIEVNKDWVKRLQDTIALFAQKNEWNMQASGSGLWYAISRSGNADTIRDGDLVQLAYTVSLLNGTLLYTSDSLGLKNIKVGQGGVESGVEEALRMLTQGDSARLLIPPHLAHGLLGDQQKIPSLAILNYTLVVTRHYRP